MRDDNHREASGKKEERRNRAILNKRINTVSASVFYSPF